MLLVYVILLSALAGSCLTLLLQLLLLYRKKPESPEEAAAAAAAAEKPMIRTRIVPDSSLKDYFAGSYPGGKQQQQQQEAAAAAAGGQSPTGGASSKPEQNPNVGSSEETCFWLNAICLFLFRELRDTSLIRHYVTRKIKVEFEELLQTKVTGKVLEGLSLRDVCLGDVVPHFKAVKLLRPVICSEEGCPEELDFEIDLEYSGGFHLAIDADLVFGKSAYLFVKISKLLGRIRLVFTRLPYTHWSFAFVDEPLIGIEVKSQFEGRPIPQLASIIVSQFKKVIKRKHTLPYYKIRFKPFFSFQVLPPSEYQDRNLSIQDFPLAEGRLKVSLLECSRLLIFGSYEREANVHCTFEISSNVWEEKTRTSIRTAELIKGNVQSVGLTLRLIQPKEGEAGQVIVETVTPNSAAAAADLQRGDRLIAIGGVKITSTVQVLKLIKQAGDRVLVFYERPVGLSQQGSTIQDGFGQSEDSTFPDDDTASVITEIDLDSEFEDLGYEIKSPEPREEVSASPKSTFAAKPLGSISPILNRKLHIGGGHQTPSRSHQKDGAKQAPPKSAEVQDPSQQSNRSSYSSTTKPPVPPRPQIKVTSPSSEAESLLETGDISSEKPERPPPPANNGDKCTEKVMKITDPVEDPAVSKPTINKLDVVKDGSETLRSSKDGASDLSWETPEIPYRNRQGRWSRTKASSYIFEVEGLHKYLNIAIWCRDPFKIGGLVCLGHVSIKLEEIALDSIATSSMEFIRTLGFNPPAPKAAVTRTALRSLATHKGFNEKFCYGDITVHFKYLREGEPEDSCFLLDKERDYIPEEDVPVVQKEDPYLGQIIYTENKHNFQDTQFQNPTWCHYCKKKVWTKAASQCMVCAYVCHKKCQEKCMTDAPFCIGAERRLDRIIGSYKLEGQEPPQAAPPRAYTDSKSTHKTGLTRHLLNTSTRLLNLRQVPKTRLAEPGADVVEPSPKHTPNTSDNEASDNEMGGPNSPSKRAKLARKEGGLDDSVFIAVKEIGRDLFRSLPTEERFQKLEVMLDKLQYEIDQELENNNLLIREERETTDARKKALISAALAKSGERLQALTLLMIHYKAGIEDIEALENTTLDQEAEKMNKNEDELTIASEMDQEDVNLVVAPILESIVQATLDKRDEAVD
uniref:PDZ domain containing 8 n=1 Tax=Sphenodon punctatus TaxID=8508 RepID=A0A8D0G8L9_SPHPU